jgi:hypothetical protein
VIVGAIAAAAAIFHERYGFERSQASLCQRFEPMSGIRRTVVPLRCSVVLDPVTQLPPARFSPFILFFVCE